jgi:prophage antirepressor-like protein
MLSGLFRGLAAALKQELSMNELARLVSFSLYSSSGGFPQRYHVVDRDGNPWFAAKDVGEILGITKNYRNLIASFPENEKSYVVAAVFSRHGTSRKPGARKTQKILIINEQGLFRLILKSRKLVAQGFKEKLITELLPAYRKHGVNWASPPKIWSYRGQALNYPEWRAKKEEAYFKRHPDASLDDFIRSLPV